ncbi:MAG: stage II sporulation protein M [Desulfuromonadales bacterium]|nr:stage II sporulation protein M [Desulfuromonadales bacterium]NIR33857.1 stage II sporulation protein M [Desulfuromonadales bacterium]NIS40008.1 stage II sporulation protein M [Desulfuromonadales bacterium]
MRDLCADMLADLLEKKFFLLLACLIFVLGIITSFLTRNLAESLLLLFIDSLQPHIVDRAFLPLALFILSRNTVALFLMVFLGAVFSIFPLLALFANGFIVGAALLVAPLSWWKILPHGIFEIPAIFIAAAYGLWLGLWPFAGMGTGELRNRLAICTCAYIKLILPLLILAGLVEATLITQIR